MHNNPIKGILKNGEKLSRTLSPPLCGIFIEVCMTKRKMSENSLKNLKPNTFNDCEIAKKAQIKSVESRKENAKERKLLKEICEIVGEQTDDTTGESNKVAIVKAMFLKAKNGDVNAFNTLRDTLGEKPTDKQEIIGNVGIQKVFITAEEDKATDKHIDDVIND